MKVFTTIFLVLLSVPIWATNYYTIDVNGVIKWSTDGVTDCNCNPGASTKQDSIFVQHPYTFPVGYFGADGAIEAPMQVNATVGQVIFEDDIEIRKISIEILESNVQFKGDFKITGAGQNIGSLRAIDNSSVFFEGDFEGNKQGSGYVFVHDAMVHFSDFTQIHQLRVVTLSGANLTFGKGTSLLSSWIINGTNTAVTYGDNMLIENTEFDVFTNNVNMGEDVRFTDESIISLRANAQITFPGTTEFKESGIYLYAGSVGTFSDGISIDACEINIAGLAIINITNALINHGSSASKITVSGLLKCFGVTNILNTEMLATSSGIIDLSNATFCDFSGSVLKNSIASNTLSCGGVYNPDQNEFNIWENQSWSQGSAPNNVGVYAEIRDDYVTGDDGNIVCGNLFIETNKNVEISEDSYIKVTQDFNSFGNLLVKNNGSIVFLPGTNYNGQTGSAEVQRIGLQSNMKYNIWSSPVQDTFGILLNYPETNPCDMYVFEASAQIWSYDYAPYTETTCLGNPVIFQPQDVISGGDGLMDAGRGYFFPGNDLSQIRSFKGKLNNGVIEENIYTTNQGGSLDWDGDDWNLVGNPYPSGLDLNLFWTTNAVQNKAISDGVYFWLEDSEPPYDQFASYGVWNLTGQTYYYDASGSKNVVGSIVPAGLGFWVNGNDPDSIGSEVHTLIFDNSMRTSNQSGASANATVLESEAHKAWINIRNDSGMFDQILIGTNPNATDGIDLDYDAHLNFNWEPLIIASVIQNQLFTIQGLAPMLHVDTSFLELLIKIPDSITHYLVLDSAAHFNTHKRLFLIDSLKGTEQELLLGQEISIDFDSAGIYARRFYLKITNSFALDIADLENDENIEIFSFGNFLEITNRAERISKVTVFDMRGVPVFSNNNVGDYQLKVNVPWITGMYLVQVQSESGYTIVKSVFIQ